MSGMGRAAGTERQVEPTTGHNSKCQRSAPSALPLRSAHGGFILSGPPSSSALAFAQALEVSDQSREFVVLGIEVGHGRIEGFRQPLQGSQAGLVDGGLLVVGADR